ncbi:MAG: hypothetical protein V8R91_03240 [Butyricimonas faecihominis]
MFTYKLGHKLRMPSIGNVYIQDRVYKTYEGPALAQNREMKRRLG